MSAAARVVCALGVRGGRRGNLADDPVVRAELARAAADLETVARPASRDPAALREQLLREARALPERVPTKAGGETTREAAVLFLLDRSKRDPVLLGEALAAVRRLVAEAPWARVPAELRPLADACRRLGETGWGVYEGFRLQVDKSGTLTLEAAVARARAAADAWEHYTARFAACGSVEALDAVLEEAKADGRLLHSHLWRLKRRHAELLPGPWAEYVPPPAPLAEPEDSPALARYLLDVGVAATEGELDELLVGMREDDKPTPDERALVEAACETRRAVLKGGAP